MEVIFIGLSGCVIFTPKAYPMKQILALSLGLLLIDAAHAQERRRVEERRYRHTVVIRPDMSRQQVDSVVAAARAKDITIQINTLEYNGENKIGKISISAAYKDASGTYSAVRPTNLVIQAGPGISLSSR